MAIDFPNTPSLDEEFVSGNRVWIWDGTVWKSKSTNIALQLEETLEDANSYSDEAVNDHNLETTSVHGIADTSLLATASDLAGKQNVVSGVTDIEISYLSEVTSDIQEQIDSKAPSIHEHSISDVEGLSSALEGKAFTSHTHPISDVTNLSITISDIEEELSSLDSALSGKADTTHSHSISDVSGLSLALDGKADSIHSHAIADVALLADALDGKANTSHTHDISEINNLSDSLSSKADDSHQHPLSDITDVTVSASEINLLSNATSNIQDQINGKASSSHSHAISDISGLQDELDDKSDEGHTHILADITDVSATATQINYLGGAFPVTSSVQSQIDSKLNTSGGSLSGFLTLHADPTQAMHAVTKEYVDNVAAGIISKPSTYAATTANLDANYSNGTDGVGATLTSTSNGAFPVIDGVQLSTANGFRGILVKNQTNSFQNGRYNLTTLGDENTPWVLTKCSLCDTADEIPGSYIFVTDGTLYGGTGWILYVDDPATYVVGTDPVFAFQFSGSGTVTAGNNISVSGSQVSLVSNPNIPDLTVADSLDVSDAEITGLSLSTDIDDVTTSSLASGDILSWNGSAWINRHVNNIPAKISTVTTSTDYSLQTSDAGMVVEINSSVDVDVSLPDSPDGIPIGTQIVVMQTGTGRVNFLAGIGNALSYDSGTPGVAKLRGQWTAATFLKRATDAWVLYGDLVGE